MPITTGRTLVPSSILVRVALVLAIAAAITSPRATAASVADPPKVGDKAYPSTFVIDRGGIVRFATVSRTHGDRATAADVLAALGVIKRQASPELR